MKITAGAKPDFSRAAMAAMMRMMFTQNSWGRSRAFSSSESSGST